MAKSVEAGAEGAAAAAAATTAGTVRRAKIRIAKAVRMSEGVETERIVGLVRIKLVERGQEAEGK